MIETLIKNVREYLENKKNDKAKLKEKKYLEIADNKLQDYIKEKTPDFYCMGNLYSLIFYQKQKTSGILTRISKDRKGQNYMAFITFINDAEKVLLTSGEINEEISLMKIYESLYEEFFDTLKEGVKRGCFDRKDLEEIIRGTKKEKDLKKKRNLRLIQNK